MGIQIVARLDKKQCSSFNLIVRIKNCQRDVAIRFGTGLVSDGIAPLTTQEYALSFIIVRHSLTYRASRRH